MADWWTISGGAIYTVDDRDTFISDGSVVIREGAIAEVTGAPVSADQRLDATGCVVLPGLINAHSHLFLTMIRGLGDDLPLEPWLAALSPVINAMTPEDHHRSTAMGCREALRSGTTTVCECCRYSPSAAAQEASRIGMRVLSGGMPASEWFGAPLATDLPGLAAATRKVLDGAAEYGGLAGAFLGAHSTYNCSPEFLMEAKRLSRELGVKFNVHLAETRAETATIRQRYGKSPVRFLYDLGVLDGETIADHCVWLGDEDIEIMRSTGAGIAHCPVSNAKLASGVAPVARYLERGIPVGLATDSVVSNNGLNMFNEIRASVLLQRAASQSLAFTGRDALRAATMGSATVLGLQDKVGSIERGKRADLVVLRLPASMKPTAENVVSHIVYSADPRDLRAVFVDGRLVVRDGKLVGRDEEADWLADRRYFAGRA